MNVSCEPPGTPPTIDVEVLCSASRSMAKNSDSLRVSSQGKKGPKRSNISPEPLFSSKFVNLLPKLEDDPSNAAQKHDYLTSVDPCIPDFSDMELVRANLGSESQSSSTHDIKSGVEVAPYKAHFTRGNEGASRTNITSVKVPQEANLAAPLSSLTSRMFSPFCPQENPGEDTKTFVEIDRLKQELLAANSRIAQQEEELAQTRVIKHTLDQALGSSTDLEYGDRDVSEQTISNLQNAFNASASTRLFSGSKDLWASDELRAEGSVAWPTEPYTKTSSFWTPPTPVVRENNYNDLLMPRPSLRQDYSQVWYPQAPGSKFSHGGPQAQRVLSGPTSTAHKTETRNTSDRSPYGCKVAPVRRSVSQLSRGISMPEWEQMSTGASAASGLPSHAAPHFAAYPQAGVYPMPYYQPRPVGASLSPTAAEFTIGTDTASQWSNSMAVASPAQNYVPSLEPLNYRRLLDKNVSCDWKYIVDKIVCNNDQQASIFLQQKLKVGNTEQKYDIIEAIVHQAYPLMVNRFGNFLVQRCFEHGTPDQVVAIANAIKGNTLNLSMDPFGCHVIQKAFDSVPEEYKAFMVHELLRRIPETVIHRYACHVWQKLFELRWSNEPPQIMAKVNEALRGMWHEVALGETGSLVVQNIFENCVEDEKRPAIEEVLGKIDLLSHGQFGNWCIQHICEHGAPHDKSRAIEHILHWSADYSMDQFASKVVEKCLKIGGSDFLDRYLTRVCTGRPDRPRMPLIDIAGDQYGNYLIQWVLLHAAPHQRELVASHIRKHMVSLRGSKFGSRVAMLCCNPSHSTRPGPGAGAQISRFGNPTDERLQATSGNRMNRANMWSHSYAPFR